MEEALRLNWESLGWMFLRTLVIYVLILVCMRLAGKRQVAQLTPFDLVVLILLGNAVQNGMTGEDFSLAGAVVCALTLFLANAAVSNLRFRSSRFRKVVEGEPRALVIRGQLLKKALHEEQVTEDELMEALREQGVLRCDQVELATLEVDGTISVIRKDRGGVGKGKGHEVMG